MADTLKMGSSKPKSFESIFNDPPDTMLVWTSSPDKTENRVNLDEDIAPFNIDGIYTVESRSHREIHQDKSAASVSDTCPANVLTIHRPDADPEIDLKLAHFGTQLSRLLEKGSVEGMRQGSMDYHDSHTGMKAEMKYEPLTGKEDSRWTGYIFGRPDGAGAKLGSKTTSTYLKPFGSLASFMTGKTKQGIDPKLSTFPTSANAEYYPFNPYKQKLLWSELRGVQNSTECPVLYKFVILQTLPSQRGKEQEDQIGLYNLNEIPIDLADDPYLEDMTNEEYTERVLNKHDGLVSSLNDVNSIIRALPFKEGDESMFEMEYRTHDEEHDSKKLAVTIARREPPGLYNRWRPRLRCFEVSVHDEEKAARWMD